MKSIIKHLLLASIISTLCGCTANLIETVKHGETYFYQLSKHKKAVLLDDCLILNYTATRRNHDFAPLRRVNVSAIYPIDSRTSLPCNKPSFVGEKINRSHQKNAKQIPFEKVVARGELWFDSGKNMYADIDHQMDTPVILIGVRPDDWDKKYGSYTGVNENFCMYISESAYLNSDRVLLSTPCYTKHKRNYYKLILLTVTIPGDIILSPYYLFMSQALDWGM
jgi:hypothetical protein